MPVQTRSQTAPKTDSTKVDACSSKPRDQPTKSPISVSKPKPTARRIQLYIPEIEPTLNITFMTKEEYNKAGYLNGPHGGYIGMRLIAACFPYIYNCNEVDDISFEKYTNIDYLRDNNQDYVIAPYGYYWALTKVHYAGWIYDLRKI